jgi:thiosulfate reductase cytochrome b subunit
MVMVFNRFERFWHWAQVALILTLLFTGLAVHGLHRWVEFQSAVTVHTWAAIGLMILWIFAIFWHLTTGTWRHYVPTTEGLWRVARFYAYGVFRGEHHPYHKAFWRKHNPLQALSYLALKVLLFPLIWVTGLLYLGYNLWATPETSQWLTWVAVLHLVGAYAIGAFVIVHVYLLTVGHSFWAHLKPMLTGYDKVELSEAEEAYLEEDKTVPMK